ncbi:MAG: hypothetical protein ACKO9H_13710 [Planctomycetota bacterium]
MHDVDRPENDEKTGGEVEGSRIHSTFGPFCFFSHGWLSFWFAFSTINPEYKPVNDPKMTQPATWNAAPIVDHTKPLSNKKSVPTRNRRKAASEPGKYFSQSTSSKLNSLKTFESKTPKGESLRQTPIANNGASKATEIAVKIGSGVMLPVSNATRIPKTKPGRAARANAKETKPTAGAQSLKL